MASDSYYDGFMSGVAGEESIDNLMYSSSSPFRPPPPSTTSSSATTAERVSQAHVGVLKVVWQKDREDLNRKREEVTALTNEVAYLASELEYQNVQNSLNALYSPDSKRSSSFVDFMRNLLSGEFRDTVTLQCCVRSGQLWIAVDSSTASLQKIRDESFDNVIRSLDVGSVYHLEQLVPAQLASGSSTGSWYVVPVFPMLCVWLVGRSPSSAGADYVDAAFDACQTLKHPRLFPILETASQYCMSTVARELEDRQARAAALIREVQQGVSDLLLDRGDGNDNNDDGTDSNNTVSGGGSGGSGGNARATLRAVLAFLVEQLGGTKVGCTGCELYMLPQGIDSGSSLQHVVSVNGEVTCLDTANASLLTACIERERIITYTVPADGRRRDGVVNIVPLTTDVQQQQQQQQMTPKRRDKGKSPSKFTASGGRVDDSYGVSLHPVVDGFDRASSPPFVVAVPLWSVDGSCFEHINSNSTGGGSNESSGSSNSTRSQTAALTRVLLQTAGDSCDITATTEPRTLPQPSHREPESLFSAGMVFHFAPELQGDAGVGLGLSSEERVVCASTAAQVLGGLLRPWLRRSPGHLRSLSPLPVPVDDTSSSLVGCVEELGSILFGGDGDSSSSDGGDGAQCRRLARPDVIRAISSLFDCEWAMVLVPAYEQDASYAYTHLIDTAGHLHHPFHASEALLALLQPIPADNPGATAARKDDDDNDDDDDGDDGDNDCIDQGLASSAATFSVLASADLNRLGLSTYLHVPPAFPLRSITGSAASSTSSSPSLSRSGIRAGETSSVRSLYASSSLLAISIRRRDASSDADAPAIAIVAGRCRWAPLNAQLLVPAAKLLVGLHRTAIQARSVRVLRGELRCFAADVVQKDRVASALQDCYEALTLKHEILQRRHSDLESRHASLSRAYKTLEQSNYSLVQDHETLEAAHSDLQRAHGDTQGKLEETTLYLEDEKMRVGELLIVTADQSLQITRYEKLTEALRAQNLDLKSIQEHLEQELLHQRAEVARHAAQCEEAIQLGMVQEKHLKQVSADIGALRKANEKLHEANEAQDREICELQTAVAGLQQTVEQTIAICRKQDQQLQQFSRFAFAVDDAVIPSHRASQHPTAAQQDFPLLVDRFLPSVLSRASHLQAEHTRLQRSIEIARQVQLRGGRIERRLLSAWTLLSHSNAALVEIEQHVLASVAFLASAVALASFDEPTGAERGMGAGIEVGTGQGLGQETLPTLHCVARVHWREIPAAAAPAVPAASVSFACPTANDFTWQTVDIDTNGLVLPSSKLGSDFSADLAKLLQMEQDVHPVPFVFIRRPSPAALLDLLNHVYVTSKVLQTALPDDDDGSAATVAGGERVDRGFQFWIPLPTTQLADAHVVLELSLLKNLNEQEHSKAAAEPDAGAGGVVWGDSTGLKGSLADSSDVARDLLHSTNAADREVALLLVRLQAVVGVGLQATTEKQAAVALRRRSRAHADMVRRQVAGFLECSRVAANAIRPDPLYVGGGDGMGFGVGESKTARALVDVHTKIRSLCTEMQRAVSAFALRGLRGVVLSMETTGSSSSSSSLPHDEYIAGLGNKDRVLYRAYFPAPSPGCATLNSSVLEPHGAYRMTMKSRCDEVAGSMALLMDSEEVVSATLLDLDMISGGYPGIGSSGYAGSGESGSETSSDGLGMDARNDVKVLAEAALQLLVRRTSSLLALDKKSRIVALQREDIQRLRSELDERTRLVAVLEDCHAAAERKVFEARSEAEDATAREQAVHRVNGTLQRRLSTVQAEKVGILQLNEAMSKELARTIWYDG